MLSSKTVVTVSEETPKPLRIPPNNTIPIGEYGLDHLVIHSIYAILTKVNLFLDTF